MLGFNRNSMTSNMNTASSGYTFKISNMCRHYFAYNADESHWYINNQLYLFLPKATVGSTLEEAKAWLAQNQFSVFVQYATPVTVLLTEEHLNSLIGTNNLWSDVGPLTVAFWTHNNDI